MLEPRSEDRRWIALIKEKRKLHTFSIERYCFKEQLDFIRDAARFKTAVCSRRSGKTIACAADLTDTAISGAHVVCLYITLSRINAKRIIWPELLKLNSLYRLGGKANETELSITYPNGSTIYCSGAKDKSEVEKFRGLAIKKVYIDEVQSFRGHVQGLVDDVLSKALFDHNGTLCLIGTPGMVPAGYFYECATSSEWSHHGWTMLDNPHLEKKSGRHPNELIAEDCKRMGVGMEHPKIQRECFGKWVVDADSLIFKYNSDTNHYENLPDARSWDYVIGVDIGHDDADAISVIGWTPERKESWLISEIITKKQGVTELADQLDAVIAKYNPMRIVMDTGGLGKKIAEEIRKRRAIPVVAAEKIRKMEFIELLNDAMRTKRFFAKKESAFAQDCMLVEKDLDKSTPEKIVISDKYHSDICDSVLYAWRECLHWLHEPAKPEPKYGTPQWDDAQEQEMIKKLEEEIEQAKEYIPLDSGW